MIFLNLEEQIYRRKSARKYLDEEIDENIIHDFMSKVKPLNPKINYYYKILTSDKVNVRTRMSAPYYLALFSEKEDNYLENIGFIFQQLSLYLQSIDIGSCWVGMASLKKKDPDFVIAISFGRSNDMTRDISGFRRKKLAEISDIEDEKLIPAQIAPSAMNSQPWFFKHSDEGFDVYQVKQNILKRQVLKGWNPIDMGIALAHLYVSNMDSFEFYIKNSFDELKGYTYSGSIKI